MEMVVERKGILKMKRLWEGMGCENLGIKAQNLRDQAARLKKCSVDTTLEESRMTNDLGHSLSPTRITISDDENNQNDEEQGSQNANFQPNDSLNLHTSAFLTKRLMRSYLMRCQAPC